MAHDISTWLDGLGLGAWADTFDAHQIDLDAARDLTEPDLRELGIPMGPRKKLLRAIAALAESHHVEHGAPTAPAAAGAPDQAERRQLTVLFCDLVGSTALSGQFDPEDMRAILQRYQDAVAAVIGRYEGYVANYLGDGVLAYFGWPHAHEDQVVQAVRAGLVAVEAVSAIELADGTPLAARVGIATGEVVVGDLAGELARQSGAVTGETPNRAARIQGVAGPGEVAVGPTTRRLLGQAFELEPLGAKRLKGIAAPVAIWRVRGERSTDSRFEARGGAMTRFVGREAELGVLLERWRAARAGDGQVVTLSGEAGIGKSRLLQALQEDVTADDHIRLRYQCSPYHAHSAFHPVIRQLERAAGFVPGDDADTRLDKLEAITGDRDETAHLLAALLSLSYEARYGPLDLAPEARKQRTLAALVRHLLGLGRRRPVLLQFEDAHWVDPSTEELLRETVTAIADAPVLMVVTHRPEWRLPWTARAPVTALAMGRIAPEQAAAMVRAIAGPLVHADTVARIVRRTDGIPLYVEELTKALLERDEDGGDIPATLQASLAARLDRLTPSARDTAQIAAVIGREFEPGLLSAVAGRAEGELAADLDSLLRADLVFRTGRPPRASYSFKHALIQDAAYQSLLNARKRDLHGRIAKALSATEQAADVPELIAQHFESAGEADQAADLWWRAASRAHGRSANREAIELANRCIRLLADAETPAQRQTLIQAHSLIGSASVTIYGFSSAEVEQAFEATMALARRHGELDAEFVALGLQCGTVLSRYGGEAALQVTHRMLAIADLLDDDGKRALTRTVEGVALVLLGKIERSRAVLSEAWALARTAELANLPAMGGADFRIPLIGYLCWGHFLQGQTGDMAAWADKAQVIAEEDGGLFSRVWAKLSLVRSRLAQRRLDEVGAEIEASLRICRDKGFEQRAGQFLKFRGQMKLLAGSPAAALEDLKAGREVWVRAGTSFHASEFDCAMAEITLALGDSAAAQAALDQAAAHEARYGEVYYMSERLRLQGDLMRHQGGRQAAVDAYEAAIAVAHEQDETHLAFRALYALARALRTDRRDDGARDRLTRALATLPPAFDAPVRQEAETFLRQD